MHRRLIESLNLSLSPLGFGVMRLPQNADGSFPQGVYSLLSAAFEKGINYFDTAYPYLRGRSEGLVRDALVRKYPREDFYIADKLPVWECRSRDRMDRIFDEQLERLGVEYIDFYLLHGLHLKRWLDMYDRGVLDFLNEKRRGGRIRKAGFSMHDTTETLKIIERAYDWDFAQLQINYYDWVAQGAKESYEYLEARHIPCFVMEPVGGGRLSKLPPDAAKLLEDAHPGGSAAAWALRFVAGLPNVAVTLSGMGSMRELDENVRTFETLAPLMKFERDALDGVIRALQEKNPIPCTACRYCIEDCPKGIDIPQIFSRYNDCRMFDADRLDVQYFNFIPEGKRADVCIACDKCFKKCPQKIDIPRELKKIHDVAVGLSIGVDIERLQGRDNIVLFGCGADGQRALALLRSAGIVPKNFCDNNPGLWGSTVDGIMVIHPSELKKMNAAVIIASDNYRDEIGAQLEKMGIGMEHAEETVIYDHTLVDELEKFVALCKQYGRLYIYGEAHNQKMLAKYLEICGISVAGFVTSETLSDAEMSKDTGVILGLSDRHYNDVMPLLGATPLVFLTERAKQTISFKMTPRKPEELAVEINLADHCNLNCQMCDHYSQLVREPRFLDIGEFERDLTRLSELSAGRLGLINLCGGEPLLNKNIGDYLKIARKYFRDTPIKVYTNGLLLLNRESEGFWTACGEENVLVQLTPYPIKLNMKEINRKALDAGVEFLISESSVFDRKKHSCYYPMKRSRSKQVGFIECYQMNGCNVLRNGKIYACPTSAYIGYFNEYFSENFELTCKDYIDIHEAQCFEEIAEFAARPAPFCGYCDIRGRKYFSWKQSEKSINEYIGG